MSRLAGILLPYKRFLTQLNSPSTFVPISINMPCILVQTLFTLQGSKNHLKGLNLTAEIKKKERKKGKLRP